jgi:hypothetical protein
MVNICIVYETSMANTVESVAQKIERNGNEVHLLCRDKFPVADSMFSFLRLLSTKFDETFIVISGKSDSILSTWISRELMFQQSQGEFTNVHPTFVTADNIQSWWLKEKVSILSDI